MTPTEGQTARAILKQRCGRWTDVELADRRRLRVFDIAWGRDAAADFDHGTTKISPGSPVGSDHTVDFFNTSDISVIRDPETGAILFRYVAPTL
jgi:hypothetical protein